MKSTISFVKRLLSNHYLITIYFAGLFSSRHGTCANQLQRVEEAVKNKPKNSSNGAEISTICLDNRSSSWIQCFVE